MTTGQSGVGYVQLSLEDGGGGGGGGRGKYCGECMMDMIDYQEKHLMENAQL